MKVSGKYIFKTFLQLIIIIALSILVINITYGASALPNPGAEEFLKSDIPTAPEGEKGQQILIDAVFAGLRYTKFVIAAIGILYLTLLGYTLVSSGDQEEKVTEVKRGLSYTALAFLLISMSQDIGKVFDMDKGSILQNPQEILKRAKIFDKEVEIFVTFIKYFLGAYATVMIVRSGIVLITSGGEEEETTNQKKSILFSAAGLVLIYLGDIFINRVFYKINKNVYSGITGVHPQVDTKQGIEQLVGITNFIVSFLAPLSVLMLVVAGVLYATSAGEDDNMERAKRLLITTVVGIAIIFGAFALISTIISGRLDGLNAIMP